MYSEYIKNCLPYPVFSKDVSEVLKDKFVFERDMVGHPKYHISIWCSLEKCKKSDKDLFCISMMVSNKHGENFSYFCRSDLWYDNYDGKYTLHYDDTTGICKNQLWWTSEQHILSKKFAHVLKDFLSELKEVAKENVDSILRYTVEDYRKKMSVNALDVNYA